MLSTNLLIMITTDTILREDGAEITVSAPGRVNIIGEHIDYCGGTVLPFAISESMNFYIKKSKTSSVVNALDINESYTFNTEKHTPSWTSYFKKLSELLYSNYGFSGSYDLSFTSDIPIGGGLSSSSALCIGAIAALNAFFDLNLSSKDIIQMSSDIEFGVGLKGGLMDQHSIFFCKKDHALKLDCRDNSFEQVYIDPKSFHFILLDTGVKHDLKDSPYNKRRESIIEGLDEINKHYKTELSHCDLNSAHIKCLGDEIQRKRMAHVVNEMERVNQAVECIKTNNPQTLGQLLYKSHESLSQLYEVSCEEADYIIGKLKEISEVLGARIMGGGFGGHLLALLRDNEKLNWFEPLQNDYYQRYGIRLIKREVYPSDGLKVIKPV